MKQLKIKIKSNGEIEAETIGIKGKACLKYIAEIEKMTNAVTIDSKFTKEYLEERNEEEIVTEEDEEEEEVTE